VLHFRFEAALGKLQHLADWLCALYRDLPVECGHLPCRQVGHGVDAWRAAIAVALAFLAVFWLAYDAICRAVGSRKHGEKIVGALVAILVCAVA
jgi:uncharacterized membrane protein